MAESGSSDEMAMEKPQDGCVSGNEKVKIGDYGVYRFATEGERTSYDESYLKTVVADELRAEKRKKIVLDLYKRAPETYGFLRDDYMTRALLPLRKILVDFLDRFDPWPYWLARFVYVAMRDARRSLLVPVPEFTEIFEMAQRIIFKWETVLDTRPADINREIAELRKRIVPWVQTLEGHYTSS
ncbi:hypothetical protein ACHQM5_025165 [Ranunculus cassubicifolius]